MRWYLVQTKPSREAVAQSNLERQGFEVYYPQLARCERWGKRPAGRVALFPRYMFLHLDEGHQSLRPVHSTLGVANVVRFGSQYTVVPEVVIRELRLRADPETGLHRLTGAAPLVRGTSVRVCAGVFDGLQGIFERISGTDRVVVLLGLLGATTAVQVPADYVRLCVDT